MLVKTNTIHNMYRREGTASLVHNKMLPRRPKIGAPYSLCAVLAIVLCSYFALLRCIQNPVNERQNSIRTVLHTYVSKGGECGHTILPVSNVFKDYHDVIDLEKDMLDGMWRSELNSELKGHSTSTGTSCLLEDDVSNYWSTWQQFADIAFEYIKCMFSNSSNSRSRKQCERHYLYVCDSGMSRYRVRQQVRELEVEFWRNICTQPMFRALQLKIYDICLRWQTQYQSHFVSGMALSDISVRTYYHYCKAKCGVEMLKRWGCNIHTQYIAGCGYKVKMFSEWMVNISYIFIHNHVDVGSNSMNIPLVSVKSSMLNIKKHLIGGEIPINNKTTFKQVRGKNKWTGKELYLYKMHSNKPVIFKELDYIMTGYNHVDRVKTDEIALSIPLKDLVNKLPKKDLDKIIAAHGFPKNLLRKRVCDVRIIAENHPTEDCKGCQSHLAVFSTEERKLKGKENTRRRTYQMKLTTHLPMPVPILAPLKGYNIYPPQPMRENKVKDIINSFCDETDPINFEEVGCAICGMLNPKNTCTPIQHVQFDWDAFIPANLTVSRIERQLNTENPVNTKPVMDEMCNYICNECHKLLKKNKIPLLSLMNGNWVGAVPPELQGLRFAEKLLIAKNRPNYCLVRVESGMSKLKASAVLIPNPVPKIFQKLPPPQEDNKDMLAFIYTGPLPPTKKDILRTPLLVRRHKITAALNWLKLNHVDYLDIDICEKNINSYNDNDSPVTIEFHERKSNKYPVSASVDDQEKEDGTSSGECPFIVYGLTSDMMQVRTPDEIKAEAMKHMESGGKSLGIGSANHLASLYNNPQLYPQAFPWLFPYGLGGVGNRRGYREVPEHHRIRQLLMYHDKRFQKDSCFVLMAFNHRQIKSATTSSFLLTKRATFGDIAERMLTMDSKSFRDIARRIQNGEYIVPETDAEKHCYQIIKDIEGVSGHIQGSSTSRRWMNKEVWSLLYNIGSPVWYITFAPADERHPICLHLAGDNEKFSPDILHPKIRRKLIADNPVACARFFHVMVHAFLLHVLKISSSTEEGLWGKTKGYYGTVEQQGRLTLHLHMLLWIDNSITPKETRDRILNMDSDFNKALIAYLEAGHQGEYVDEMLEQVKETIDCQDENPEYSHPAMTLPEKLPVCNCDQCEDGIRCSKMVHWWKYYKDTINHILFKCNRHDCSQGYCLDNKYKTCKARFPRKLYEETTTDEMGHMFLKHKESQLNTFTPALTYMFRCNTDTTCLQSGTGIKAVLMYITDYITKSPLKLYNLFQILAEVNDKHNTIIGDDEKSHSKARKIITKTVNLMSTHMQIGAPMAAAFLLGLPDHYSSHKFKAFYWRSFVSHVLNCYELSEQFIPSHGLIEEKVVIIKSQGKYSSLNAVQDYTMRPKELDHISLYDWVTMFKKVKIESDTSSDEYDYESQHSENNDDRDTINIEDENVYNSSECSEELSKYYYGESNNMDIDEEVNDPVIIIKEEKESYSKPVLGSKSKFKKRKLEEYEDNVMVNCEEDILIKNEDNAEMMTFLPKHPQSGKYRIDKLKIPVVPNILGGSIPRSNTEDKEYYYATMMTLFKPWRNGGSLKLQTDRWDHVFSDYKFTKRHQDIMKFMNIKHECIDSLDDYKAQRQKYSTFSNVDIEREIIDEENMNVLDKLDNNIDNNSIVDIIPSRKMLIKWEEMLGAELRMFEAGWKETINKISLKSISYMNSIIDNHVTSIEWASRIQQVRDKINKRIIIPQIPNSNNSNIQEKIKLKCIQRIQDEKVNIIDHTEKYIEYSKIPGSEINGEILIGDSIMKYKLNEAQIRAFKIIANHSLNPNSDQLLMYLGGMAGTGKSQVVRALSHFFESRGESQKLKLAAPTGSAAVLIGGSTYHSLLGFSDRDSDKTTATALSKVSEKLRYCRYLLIDEVSMLSCKALNDIDERLSRVKNSTGESFGGINIILCGDFAQLPPVKATPLYCSDSIFTTSIDMTKKDQANAMGKTLWRKFTTVVILRENMRQKSMSNEDIAYRKALENMRYRACTIEDVNLLSSLISNGEDKDNKLKQSIFDNVSIITARNKYRDKINEMGTKRFAAASDQTLTDFHSIDTLSEGSVKKALNIHTKGRIKKALVQDNNVIRANQQDTLWSLYPHMTEHKAGILSLCIGMPIMIKKNIATELCITNGAEGYIVGWKDAHLKRYNKSYRIVDTLYVLLKDPPFTVQIKGLPPNVVPLNRTSSNIECELYNNSIEYIKREQVDILPNFAMTDFSSQGRTRMENVLDLTECNSHFSYYTCFSRSSTVVGTIIIGGFNEKIIRGGITGWLRQEFRELEILDDITQLRENSQLSDTVTGNNRITLIRQFKKCKCEGYEPPSMHPSLYNNNQDSLVLKKVEERKISNTNGKEEKTYNKHVNKKRKTMQLCEDEPECPNDMFYGFKWENNSCAFDSLFAILWFIYNHTEVEYLIDVYKYNNYFCTLLNGFRLIQENVITPEELRNNIRNNLIRNGYNQQFGYHLNGVILARLIELVMCSNIPNVDFRGYCDNCGIATEIVSRELFLIDILPRYISQMCDNQVSHESIFTNMLQSAINNSIYQKCNICNHTISNENGYFNRIPRILVVNVQEMNNTEIPVNIEIKLYNEEKHKMKIGGLVYHGDNHFTTRIINREEKVYYNDGIYAQRKFQYECKYQELSVIKKYYKDDRKLCFVIYYTN